MKKVNTSKKAVRTLLKQMVNILNTGDKNANLLWGIISALRGPDVDKSSTLKPYTTGRIRAIIGLEETENGLVINQLPLGVVELHNRQELLADSAGHFQNHYSAAVTAIEKLYGYNLKTEKKI